MISVQWGPGLADTIHTVGHKLDIRTRWCPYTELYEGRAWHRNEWEREGKQSYRCQILCRLRSSL